MTNIEPAAGFNLGRQFHAPATTNRCSVGGGNGAPGPERTNCGPEDGQRLPTREHPSNHRVCTEHRTRFTSFLRSTSHPRPSASCGAGAPLFPLVHVLHLFPSSLFLSFIGFTYFLLLSIPSLSIRIVPLHFQAGGRRRRPNLGLVCFVLYFVLSVSLN